MKKDVRIIFEDTAYRFMPNSSIENDVLDKVRYTIDNNKFAGNFTPVYGKVVAMVIYMN